MIQKHLKTRPKTPKKTCLDGIGQKHGKHSWPLPELVVQGILGNHGVLRRAGLPIQRKAEIDRPRDLWEVEADRAAEAVMGKSDPTVPANRIGGLDRVSDYGVETEGNDGSALHSINGGGNPLPKPVREFFEPRFRRDFSRVRIHTDSNAEGLARKIDARAFAVGENLFFGQGQYAPETHEGRRLLAHELAHTIQQRRFGPAAQPVLRKKENDADIDAMDWGKAVEKAEKAVEDGKKDKAKEYYKKLVVRASQNVAAPAPLVDRKPKVKDINWNASATAAYAATTDPKKVDDHPDDYWKWLTFNPSAVHQDKAFTESIIFHELDHAAHAKALYDKWVEAGKDNGEWDDFYLSHFEKWTEKEITLEQPGLVGALSGLPEKIAPSAIEFRAYANQFVNYFHKVSLDRQDYLGKAIILFYPLKITTVNATISDPALDLSSARQWILDYFSSPPVKDASQKTIKILVAMKMNGALLFRPSDDHEQIRKDFKAIFDLKTSSEERRNARRTYEPE